jgi:hypothetical protein
MSVLIVGGDRVTPYRDYLHSKGFDDVRHWNGRKGSDSHRQIPLDTRLIVILVDYVNHSLATKTRRNARDRGLPVIFCKRCVAQLEQALEGLQEPAWALAS